MDDIEMARIDGGAVTLRALRGSNRWTVEVEPFEIGVFAVTAEQAAELVGHPAVAPRRPATDVSWIRAVRLCNAASEWEGLESAYSFDGELVSWDPESEGFRLPTEAEWELACRAGSPAAQYGPVREIAWTSLDGITGPQNVGGKLPNLNGLFDTLGNTWEWCWDLVDADRGAERVIRGGGFADDAASIGASVRRGAPPRSSFPDVGVRFARGPVSA